MSRVSYVMMNPGGDVEMTKAVREAINYAGRKRVPRKPASTSRDILEVTFVGNPIMHHLLLGIDPTELGGAPFALATDGAITFWATRDRSAHPSQCAHLSCCPASPAMSAPTRPA